MIRKHRSFFANPTRCMPVADPHWHVSMTTRSALDSSSTESSRTCFGDEFVIEFECHNVAICESMFCDACQILLNLMKGPHGPTQVVNLYGKSLKENTQSPRFRIEAICYK
jgi:hypothetical protein